MPLFFFFFFQVSTTNDSFKYKEQDVQTKIFAIWDGEVFLDRIDELDDRLVASILESTSFYNESGGQVADAGFITGERKNFFSHFEGYVVGEIPLSG